MTDSLPSLAEASPDTMGTIQEEPHFAVLLSYPAEPEHAQQRPPVNWGTSFILTALFILFFVVALRFRNNMKYASSIFKNLVETRTRHNVFDDTVRETSLVVLLNILWCACSGVILFGASSFISPGTNLAEAGATGMVIGIVAAIGYTIFMSAIYWCVGWVFSDSTHASMWVKGFIASQGLMSLPFLVIAVVAICYPSVEQGVIFVAAFIFIMVKLVFIWKGYKIFFNQFSSWMLFLCYLCSLEIVPLVLTLRLAFLLAEKF